MPKTGDETPTEIVCEKKNDWVTFKCRCQKRWKVTLYENKRIILCQCKSCGKPYRITIRLPRAEERNKAEASDKIRILFPEESKAFSCRVLDYSNSGLKIEMAGVLRKKLHVGEAIFIRRDILSEDKSKFEVRWIKGLLVGLHSKTQPQYSVQKFLDLAVHDYQDPWEKATHRFL